MNDEWRLRIDVGDEGRAGSPTERPREQAEGSGQVAWAERPSNPFAVFGGLGG